MSNYLKSVACLNASLMAADLYSVERHVARRAEELAASHADCPIELVEEAMNRKEKRAAEVSGLLREDEECEAAVRREEDLAASARSLAASLHKNRLRLAESTAGRREKQQHNTKKPPQLHPIDLIQHKIRSELMDAAWRKRTELEM